MKELPFRISDRLSEAGPSLLQRLRAQVSLANLWMALRTLAWLAPLTILVWFYAARSISTSYTMDLRLRIQSADPNRHVTIEDPPDGRIKVEIVGPQAEVDRLKRAGTDLNVVLQATQILGAQNPPGPVLLREGTDLFRRANVRVQRTEPPQVALYVDELVERQVPVRPPESIRNLQSAVFDPPTVTVRAPARRFAAAEAAGGLFAEADLAGLPQLREPGKKDPITVPVRCALGTPTPGSVVATLDVRSDDVTVMLSSVPVFASVPPSFADEYRLTLNPPFIANVRVIGPPEQIALLQREGGFPYRAQLDFLPSELTQDLPIGRARTKKPTFILPEGVRVDPAEMDRIAVEWSLSRRNGG
ncbi:MAG: hypothetical protein NZ561_00530 [Phycisphaerae bacterium]|nr:hypothetical protein [Phycisphaerae bacterium]MDW8261104.1 hypothetical protein [Phycisphaerales bacterium]